MNGCTQHSAHITYTHTNTETLSHWRHTHIHHKRAHTHTVVVAGSRQQAAAVAKQTSAYERKEKPPNGEKTSPKLDYKCVHSFGILWLVFWFVCDQNWYGGLQPYIHTTYVSIAHSTCHRRISYTNTSTRQSNASTLVCSCVQCSQVENNFHSIARERALC